MDDPGGNFVPRDRQPFFNAPWPSVVLLGALTLAFAVQMTILPDAVQNRLALSPLGLRGGAVLTLVSYIFLHSGWTHFLMNGASALAFAPPVARALGVRGRGPVLFFIFFLLCGVLSGLGFCLLHWKGDALVIGASGAISGLWGAASRMLGRRGALASPFDRQVITQAIAFAILNGGIGLAGVFSALQVAWEAHLIGYLAGLLLIGPFVRLASQGIDRSREMDLLQS
jgi:membrane associated rhomboid family serine protease